MSRPEPPKLARWLLTRCVSNDALIGDLAEELRSGRSGLWYWKQVLSVLIRQSLSSKLTALRWLGTLPIAMFAAIAVRRVIEFFAWRSITTSHVSPVAGAQPRLNNIEHFWMWMAFAAFLMGIVFVSVGVWVAPTRKDSVARIGLSVVTILSVSTFVLMGLWGAPLRPLIEIVVCPFLGGVTGYFLSMRQKPVLSQS